MVSEPGDAGPSRRAFLARFAGAAFAAPVIASFALDGVAQAGEKQGHQPGHRGHGYPNGGNPQQGYPNGGNPHQGYPNGGNPQQGYPNGGNPHQGYPNGGNPIHGYPNGGNPIHGYPNGGNPHPEPPHRPPRHWR
jgi:hypothetical protein